MEESQNAEPKAQEGYISNWAKATVLTLFVGFSASLSYVAHRDARELAESEQRRHQRIERDYTTAYQQALRLYADMNNDDLVSRAEADEFERKLYLDKKVTLLPGELPKYADGKTVPLEILTQWIQLYDGAHTIRMRGPQK